MVKQVRNWLIILLAVVGFAVIVGGIGFLATGISAKPEPSALESAVATRLRSLAIPASARDRQNPVPGSPEVTDEGMAHWADHCATATTGMDRPR